MDNGFRQSMIDCYVERAGKCLEFAQTHKLSPDMLENFRATLHAKKVARQTINNYCIAIKSFHGMLGDKVSSKPRAILKTSWEIDIGIYLIEGIENS